jgi:hypothetical protein
MDFVGKERNYMGDAKTMKHLVRFLCLGYSGGDEILLLAYDWLPWMTKTPFCLPENEGPTLVFFS